MKSTLLAAIAFFMVVAIGTLLRQRTGSSQGKYKKREMLLTPAELRFRETLVKALPASVWIHAQVSLRALLEVASAPTRSKHHIATNRIHGKYIDFVLCDESTSRILCAIELNDSSHQREDRRIRDGFLREAFSQAQIPFLEVKAARQYDVAQLRAELSQAGIKADGEAPRALAGTRSPYG